MKNTVKKGRYVCIHWQHCTLRSQQTYTQKKLNTSRYKADDDMRDFRCTFLGLFYFSNNKKDIRKKRTL